MRANPLWDYSLRLYAVAGVAERCVALQDEHCANVNLLLLCCWCGQFGVILDAAALRSAEGAIAEWDRTMVAPLRSRRRNPKLSLPESAGERQRLLAEELCAERREQDILYAWFEAREKDADCSVRQAVVANLANYASLLAVPELDFAHLRDAALAD